MPSFEIENISLCYFFKNVPCEASLLGVGRGRATRLLVSR
jgi:hypothetical protein